MKCKVDGCDRNIMYKKKRVCQKHYFRFMRNGTYDRKVEPKYRIQNMAGYQKIREPDFVLSDSTGYVYEHRFVYFNEISSNVSKCELCKKDITWKDCHIDHVDEDVTNNKKENLRALCRACNVQRGHTQLSNGTIFIEHNGKTMTPTAWARIDGVVVSGQTIRRRYLKGASPYEAIFGAKATHKNKAAKKTTIRYDDNFREAAKKLT